MPSVIYEIFPRCFSDGNGDGVGDLTGAACRADYLRWLGVDAVWLCPIYASAWADGGYDVQDHYSIDRSMGGEAALSHLVDEMHGRNIQVILDLVANHTSTSHRWFIRAFPAGTEPDWNYADCYFVRSADRYPFNNWRSVFGGTAWERKGNFQYLHSFSPGQADLNWRNNRVRTSMREVISWLLRFGIDGLRVDVAHGMIKDDQLRDCDDPPDDYRISPTVYNHRSWHQPETLELLAEWSEIVHSWKPDAIMIGEVVGKSLTDYAGFATYIGQGNLDSVYPYHLLKARLTPESVAEAIRNQVSLAAQAGIKPAWALESHDHPRLVSRIANRLDAYSGAHADWVQPVAGHYRTALAFNVFVLALPGTVYVYAGQELGLPQVELAPEYRKDPQDPLNSGVGSRGRPGRDGSRIPIPWTSAEESYGFSPSGRSYLPQPISFADRSVASQREDEHSFLVTFRQAVALRKLLNLPAGTVESVTVTEGGCLAVSIALGQARRLCSYYNMGSEAVSIGLAGQRVFSSESGATDVLPPGCACWQLYEDNQGNVPTETGT